MTGFDPRRFGDYAGRDYMRAKGFQDYGLTYATPLPGEEFPAARDCRLSSLHHTLKEKGAVFTQTFGWERPKWFSLDGREEEHSYRRNNVFEVVRDECQAVRERVGVIDLTGFAKYDVTGADAEAFLNRVLANRMPRRDGGIALAHFLSKNGRILGEATVTRRSSSHFYLLSAASAELRDLDHLLQQVHAGEQVEIRNVTEARGVIVLAGPRARDVLGSLTDASLESADFPWRSAQEIDIAGDQHTGTAHQLCGRAGVGASPCHGRPACAVYGPLGRRRSTRYCRLWSVCLEQPAYGKSVPGLGCRAH